jgi:hypothetical protein
MLLINPLRRRFTGHSRSGRTRRREWFSPLGIQAAQVQVLENRRLLSALTVTTAADSGAGSLRAEIAAAHSGDTINFANSLKGQTITLTSGELVVNKNLDIEGLGAAKLAVSGNHASRVFDIQNAANVTIAGLTIADGNVVDDLGGGVANESGSTLHLVNDVVAGNTVHGIGGGVFNDQGATLFVSGSTFVGNKAIGSQTFAHPDEDFPLGGGGTEGGGIDNDGTATVVNSAFIGNVAQGVTGADGTGGIGKAGAIASDGILTVRGSLFQSNLAIGGDGAAGAAGQDGATGGQSEGGAIGVFGTGNVDDINSSVFANNKAVGGTGGTGGAGANGGHGGVGAAGALTLDDATLTLTHSSFVGNEAVGGTGGTGGSGGAGGGGGIGRGGAYVHTVTFGASTPLSNLSNVAMIANEAIGGAGGTGGVNGNGGNGGSGQGGGIRALLGTINVDHGLLFSNAAVGGVGGAAGAGGAAGGNGGNGQGGGLLTTFGVQATLSNSLLLGNVAQGGAGAAGGNGGNGLGGGIYNDGPVGPFAASHVTLENVLVLFNEAEGGAAGAGGTEGEGLGGGIYNLGTLDLVMAKIAHNKASTSNDDIFP